MDTSKRTKGKPMTVPEQVSSGFLFPTVNGPIREERGNQYIKNRHFTQTLVGFCREMNSTIAVSIHRSRNFPLSKTAFPFNSQGSTLSVSSNAGEPMYSTGSFSTEIGTLLYLCFSFIGYAVPVRARAFLSFDCNQQFVPSVVASDFTVGIVITVWPGTSRARKSQDEIPVIK